MLRNLLFFIKEAFLSTKKNGIMSFATIVSLIATLLIVGLFLIISLNIDNILSDIESQLVAIVYLSDSATEEEVNEIIQNAIETEGVKEVKYISKEDAFQKLKSDLSEHEEILAGITENPLPASLEITVTDTAYLEEISFNLNQFEKIEEVNYGGQLTKNLLLILNLVRRSGLAIIYILVFISILLMVSVIKISVHSRYEEIEIMALVGATSWFIRWPFIIEGFLKGLLSSLAASFIVSRGYLYYMEKIKLSIPFINIILDNQILLRVSVILILLGVFIGIFGSIISLRKISFGEL